MIKFNSYISLAWQNNDINIVMHFRKETRNFEAGWQDSLFIDTNNLTSSASPEDDHY